MTEPTNSRWHFDLQTLILIGGIGATLVAWGYTLSELQGNVNRNTEAIVELASRMERNDSKTELTEVRVVALERIAQDAITLRRELESTIGDFKSDIAVIKEILERIDKEQNHVVRP